MQTVFNKKAKQCSQINQLCFFYFSFFAKTWTMRSVFLLTTPTCPHFFIDDKMVNLSSSFFLHSLQYIYHQTTGLRKLPYFNLNTNIPLWQALGKQGYNLDPQICIIETLK